MPGVREGAWREISFMESNGVHNAEGVSQRLFFNQVGGGKGRGYARERTNVGRETPMDRHSPLKLQVVAWKEVGILQEGLRPPPKMHACTERAKSGRSPSPLPYRSELQSSAAEHFPLAPIYPAPFSPSLTRAPGLPL